jgi:hypothetical protein
MTERSESEVKCPQRDADGRLVKENRGCNTVHESLSYIHM